MTGYRTEHDSMGDMLVPEERLWGAQTQRSFENFPIGDEKMPKEIIRAFAYLKLACAKANAELSPQKMTREKEAAIEAACKDILDGRLPDEFPLSVWQTGSGTQTNMNVNEVIANYGSLLANAASAAQGAAAAGSAPRPAGASSAEPAKKLLHPNDDVNMSQSSNDTFPSAMHIAAAQAIHEKLLPAIEVLRNTLLRLEKENEGIITSGRTHLQDAVPIAFSQEISGWRGMLEVSAEHLKKAVESLCQIAIGATAVGTGLNAPAGFGDLCAEHLRNLTGLPFSSAKNKFHALTSADRYVYAHGAVKGLAADMMKIANDIRWLASGPRNGLGEIRIPENEPGSSIMPGKVNPTQCESMTMVAVQVLGNDAAIGMAASQGNFQLNVFLPVMAYNFLQSVRLLSDGILSFEKRCVSGIQANKEKMQENLNRSLMLVTALSPRIGYENAAKVAKCAYKEGLTLREACVKLDFLTEEEFDDCFHPEEMV